MEIKEVKEGIPFFSGFNKKSFTMKYNVDSHFEINSVYKIKLLLLLSIDV